MSLREFPSLRVTNLPLAEVLAEAQHGCVTAAHRQFIEQL